MNPDDAGREGEKVRRCRIHQERQGAECGDSQGAGGAGGLDREKDLEYEILFLTDLEYCPEGREETRRILKQIDMDGTSGRSDLGDIMEVIEEEFENSGRNQRSEYRDVRPASGTHHFSPLLLFLLGGDASYSP